MILNDLGHKARFILRAVFALLSVVVVILVALVEKKVLPLSPGQQVALICVFAGLTGIDNLRQAINRYRQPEKEQAKIRAQKPIIGVLLALAKAKNLQVEHLGSSIFVLRRRRIFFWKHQLVRRVRFRLANHPQATDVEWVKGKGAVGTCWETGQTQHRYRRPVAEKYGGQSYTDAEFAELAKLKKSVTSGFSREEFMSMVCKYAEVLAVPIRSEQGEFMGIVSIDLSVESRAGSQYLNDGVAERLVVEGAIHLLRDDLNQL